MLRRLRRGAVQRRGRRGPGPPLRFMITPLGPAVRENLVWDSVYFVFCSMFLLRLTALCLSLTPLTRLDRARAGVA